MTRSKLPFVAYTCTTASNVTTASVTMDTGTATEVTSDSITTAPQDPTATGG